MHKKTSRSWVIVAMMGAVFGLAIQAKAADSTADEALPRDPHNVYGTFDNGLKYIIRKASNPAGKISLDLHVQTGSLNETERQNGLAHFLEHMAFKGSTHFPSGKLMPYLASLGLTFGADTNAATNQISTVFKLTLPDTQPQTIDTALTVFADDAAGLLLDPKDIDSERGVVLEELRSRKGASQRIQQALYNQLLPGTPFAIHNVIGDESIIAKSPRSEFVDYWNTWYRPENMTLIVAGDIDPEAIIAQAKIHLAGVTAHGQTRPSISTGIKPFDSARTIVLSDPELYTAKVMLECMQPSPGKVQTVAQYRLQFVRSLAEMIVNRRFSDRITRGNAPFRSADVGTANVYNEALEVSAEAEGRAENWKAMLDSVIAEMNSALDYGFTGQELKLAVLNTLSADEWRVKTESSENSNQLVASLSSQVASGNPILSAQQRLDLHRTILSTLTKEELHQVFKDTFDTRNYAYVLTLPAPKGNATLPTHADLLAAATAAWAKQPEPVAETVAATSLLTSQPVPGKIVSTETDAQLGITTAIFANGVVAHHKFLDSQKDQVVIQITLPGGIIEETAQTKGLSSLASQMLIHHATHRLASTEIRDMMAGKNVAVQGAIGLDSMTIAVHGSPADLPQGLELTYALLTDGKLESSAVEEWKKAELEQLQTKETSAGALLGDAYAQTIGAGDVRLSPLTPDLVNTLKADDAERWFGRIAARSAIEVAVVGDISADRAFELVGQFLGALPQRTGTFSELNPLRKLNRPAGPFVKTLTFPGITPTAVVSAGYMGCEQLNLDRRPLSIAGAILTTRMIDRIRIKDNLVYSIGCQNKPGFGIDGLGTITASAPTAPKNADKLAATIVELFKSLADTGPTEQELATAKKQIANTLATQLKEPAFWLSQLADLDYHGRSLAELKQVPAIFNTFTAAQIRDVLRKYVTAQGEVRLEAVPDITAALPTAGKNAVSGSTAG